MFTENAAENVSGQSDNMTSHMARAVSEESLKNGGDFANNVISKVATGSVSQNGTLKGTETADAFRSYMGLNQTTAETQSSNADMQSSKVPVQPQENMADLTPQESDTLYYTDIPYDSNSFDTDNILSSNDQPADFEQGMNFPQTGSVDIESDSIPSSQAIELNSESTFNGNGNYI